VAGSNIRQQIEQQLSERILFIDGGILKPPQDAGFRALSSVSVQGKERSVMMNPFQVL
jgi:hypothetical protein